jgi:hypothetical protein
MEIEAQFAERKGSYDKIAVGLEIEKQTLEKDCDTYQVSVSPAVGPLSFICHTHLYLLLCTIVVLLKPRNIASERPS